MSRRARTGLVLLCLAGVAVNALTLGPGLESTRIGRTDFMDLYAGGKLAFTSDLYITPRVLETEARTEGFSSKTRLFLRLPCFAALYWPIAQLPYSVASPLWELLCFLGIAVFAIAWPSRKRADAILVCCWSLPLFMTLAEGQDIGFILLAMAGAAMLVRRRHPVAAGMVASLCLAKFHLFLLIPIWICARRQWKFARGLAAGSTALIALSFIAGGWNWPFQYLALLREPSSNPYGEVMPNLHALLAAMPHAEIVELAAFIVLGFAVWIASHRGRGEAGLAAALAAGILAAPHAYMADGAVLIPALLLMMKRSEGMLTRSVRLYLLAPIPWILLMTGSASPARGGLIAMLTVLACSAPRSARWVDRETLVPTSIS